jgi:threonine synthase
MGYAKTLRCRKCGQEYPLKPVNLCEFCLSPLEASYDYKAMAGAVSREKLAKGPLGMWRYREMLPVEAK